MREYFAKCDKAIAKPIPQLIVEYNPDYFEDVRALLRARNERDKSISVVLAHSRAASEEFREHCGGLPFCDNLHLLLWDPILAAARAEADGV